MEFIYPQKILFKHCDPAGIVFYPRYFEMMNDCVEAFFESALAFSFANMHPANGVPTAAVSTRFSAPSRLGDELDIKLCVTHVGRSSLGLNICAQSNGETRFSTESTLVFVDDLGKPRMWPDAIRQKLEKYWKERDDDA